MTTNFRFVVATGDSAENDKGRFASKAEALECATGLVEAGVLDVSVWTVEDYDETGTRQVRPVWSHQV